MKTKAGKKLKMYLIAKIWEAHQPWNEEICSFLHPSIDIFMPHRYNPFDIQPQEIPSAVYQRDLQEIMASDFGLILPPYGSDCAYEVGVYTGMGKPVIAFTRTDVEWLKDWMVKGGISCVVTDDERTHGILKTDPILRKVRVELISTLNDLPHVISDTVSRHKPNKKIRAKEKTKS